MASLPSTAGRLMLCRNSPTLKQLIKSTNASTRAYSSTSMSSADPSRYMTGVTEADIESNPSLAAYFEANFPDWKTEGVIVREEPPPPPTVDPLESLNIRRMRCEVRNRETEGGSRACVKMRHNKVIPGILYGSDPTRNIVSVDHSSKVMVKTNWSDIFRETERFSNSFERRVYQLSVYDGEEEVTTEMVTPRDVNWHPVKGQVFCVNYLRYYPGKPISIPIKYINEEESPAMKRGGFIAAVSRVVECTVEEGVPIPEYVELECTGARLKEVIRTERLIFPEGVKPSHRVDPKTFLVGTVFGRRGGDAGSDE